MFAADLYNENKYHNASSIFTWNEITAYDNSRLFHIPATVNYKDLVKGSWQKIPIGTILRNIDENMKMYGYSVIVFHPQQLMTYNDNGTIVNTLDAREIKDLSTVIDSVLSKNLSIVTHAELIRDYAGSSPCTHDKIDEDRWRVTGYFTPIETDYLGHPRTVIVDHNDKRIFTGSFLDDVNIEGSGKSRQGDYISTYDSGENYFLLAKPLAADGTPLEIGDIATDKSIIRTGTSNITIPTLPAPWNTKVFTASDTGLSIKGRSIDIYTGEGRIAGEETLRITSSDKYVTRKFSRS